MIIKNTNNIKKIGVSYSGGLDTSVSIKWLCNKKKKVYAYYANIDDNKKKEIFNIKKRAIICGVKKFKSLNLIKKFIKETFKMIKFNSFNIITGEQKYYNTTPISRVIIGKYISRSIKKNNVNIWCDGSTYKGNDIERFLIYSIRENKNINIYKPWLDKKFISEVGCRKKMKKYILKNKISYKFKKRNYSIDSNILGNTYEGDILENMNSSIEDVNFEYKFCNNSNIYKLEFLKGIPIKINGILIKNYKNFIKYFNKNFGGLGICDQIEDRIIGTKSRGIYESPFMYIIHNIYERLLTIIHDKDSIYIYRIFGFLLGDYLYRGKWKSDGAKILKKSMLKISNSISGRVTFKINNGKLIVLNTESINSKYIKNKVSMEKEEFEIINFKDRIGQLNLLSSIISV
ncbi:argininosuccinate synthase [Candidatus Vidania fulgoroideorum]